MQEQDILDKIKLFQFAELGVLLQGPSLALRQLAVVALEHAGGLLVTFQLPLQPGQGHHAELTTVGLPIGAAMTYGVVGHAGRHMVDETEVVHTVLVGNILLATQDIDNRGVDVLELRLLGHGHAAHCLMGVGGLEESAVANHHRRDTFVGTVEERLQTSARHAGSTDVVQVNLTLYGDKFLKPYNSSSSSFSKA